MGTPVAVARPSTTGTLGASFAPRSASATPPAIVAAQSGTAAAMATGRPRANSTHARTSHAALACGPAAALAESPAAMAGKMTAAIASARSARAGAGSARSPNAGISATAGVARAHANPTLSTSKPSRESASASAAIHEVVTGPVLVQAGCRLPSSAENK